MSTPAQTTLAALKSPQAAPPITSLPSVSAGFGSLQSFELMQRGAKLLAASTLVPKDYQNNLPNCVIALNMAERIGADPLLVMQNLYNVHGNPGWSSKFLIACVNTCGRFTALRYEWRQVAANADDFGCRAWAIEKETGERLNGTWIDWKMVKAEGWSAKNGSKWKTMPEQMFVYRAAAFWVRAYAPEISMGLQTQEEIHDVYDARRGAGGQYQVDLDSLRSANPENNGQGVVYDVAAALTRISETKSMQQLRTTWEEIVEQCETAGIAIPVELEGAAKDHEAALEQSSKL
jgi:hypothetical protein